MDEMMDLAETGKQWIHAATNYDIDDFNGFITAILHTFGYPGEYVGSSSMAEIMDWLVNAILGPLAKAYELIANLPDADTFVHIIDKLIGLVGH